MGRKVQLASRVKVKAGKRGATAVDRAIGLRVRARRLERHISQNELGDQLGVSFQQIQKYEKGTNRIGSARLVDIARILEVDTSYFLADLIKGNGEDKATASGFAEFMATTDGVKINEAMMKLGDAHRQAVIELATSLVRAYGG